MKATDKSPLTRWKNLKAGQPTKIILAILSGALLTLSFPPGRFSLLAWVALVPLFLSLDENSFSKSFKMGLISGLTHYLSLIYWITVVLGHYGNLGVLASLGPYLLLCLYLALFPAFFAALCKKFILYPLGLFWISSLWISLEYVRSNFLTGFPWCLLGYTQYKQLYLIQIADMLDQRFIDPCLNQA